MIYGVTGPSRPLQSHEQFYVRERVKRAVLRRPKTHWLVSGMAFGVDTEAVLAVWGLIPFEHIICCVPGTVPHNIGLVERADKAGARIVVTPNRHTVGDTYLARDDELVAQLSRGGIVPVERGVLLAFPEKRDPQLRSGTWATVRRARRRKHRTWFYPLDKAPKDE